jgi:xylulose-5-phosphate/fructose-6-phosphate phosphoketolase
MPGEEIDRANPQALASLIPDAVLDLSVKLEKMKLDEADLKGLELFRRASNYIAAGISPYHDSYCGVLPESLLTSKP